MRIQGFTGEVISDPGPEWGQASGVVRHQPTLVLRPSSVADVCAAVGWTLSEGRSITPRAAATGMPGGNVGPDVVLDLGPDSNFAYIGEVDETVGRVSVGPGARAADVDRAAHNVGWTLPALPSSAERCTIGGMVANNAAGARSFRYGPIANRVHALTVVDAAGEVHRLTRSGQSNDPFVVAAKACPPWDEWPKLRKNSSGYRLDRFGQTGDAVDLLVGSEGTLGVIVEATLDLVPIALPRTTVLVGADGIATLLEWTQFAREHELSACEFIGPWLSEKANLPEDPRFGKVARRSDYVLILEIEEAAASTRAKVDAIGTTARAMGAEFVVAYTEAEQAEIWGLRRRASPVIAAAAAAGRRSMQIIEDCVVPPDALGEFLERVGGLLDEAHFEAALFGHAGDANVHINPLIPVVDKDWFARARTLLEDTATLVSELGGTLAGEHGDGRLRAPFLEQIWGKETFQAFVSLKRAVDPEGILNPGVVVPTPGQDPLDGLRR